MTDSPKRLPSRSPPPDFSDEGYRPFLWRAAEGDAWIMDSVDNPRRRVRGEWEDWRGSAGPSVPLHQPLAGPPPRPGEDGAIPNLPLHHPSADPALPAGEDGAVCTRAVPRQATSAVAYVGEAPEEDDPLLGFAPYLHPAPRANSITPDRQRRFIATLAATGIVNQAARSIGKSMEALYKLRGRPGAEGFAAAWDEALERGMQRLEDCALERAIRGTPTPIVSGGQLLGTWDKPDNNLLRFMLQHRRSGRYGVQNIRPGHPIYESIRAEVRAELEAEASHAPRSLEEECATIASINAKIDKMRVSHTVMEMHRERGEVDLALEDLGLWAEDIWPIPLTEPPERGSEEDRIWQLWQGEYWRRVAMESDD